MKWPADATKAGFKFDYVREVIESAIESVESELSE